MSCTNEAREWPLLHSRAVTHSTALASQALYQMDAQSPHELTISQGEILTIESEVDGWYYGTNMRGQQGMFPISFVELV